MSKIVDLDTFRSKTVGFVFQMHNLIPTLTARENIEIPMMGHLGSRARTKRAEELLGLVGMTDRMKHLPSQLSGGQRQRVAVARALANNPPLVLADEPTGNLDTVTGLELMNLLKDLNQTQGTTFVIVTHDPSVARQTRRVLVMEDGHIVREDIIGSPVDEDLKMWRHSGLGRRLLAGDEALVQKLALSPPQLQALRQVLE
jgi:ABC-type lipoprotein export system ATPase subunit